MMDRHDGWPLKMTCSPASVSISGSDYTGVLVLQSRDDVLLGVAQPRRSEADGELAAAGGGDWGGRCDDAARVWVDSHHLTVLGAGHPDSSAPNRNVVRRD